MSIDKIENLVHNFLLNEFENQKDLNKGENVKINIRQIDKRLRLQKCDRRLTLSLQSRPIKRNTSVKVQCQSENPWSIYVSSIISLMKEVVVIQHPLPKDHILQASDINTSQQDVYMLRAGYTTRPNTVIGQQLKRSLKPGTIVYHHLLKPPKIIKKGEKITLIAKRGSLSVITPGIALSAGGKGEQIPVENKRSSRVIYGKVIGPNTVEVL